MSALLKRTRACGDSARCLEQRALLHRANFHARTQDNPFSGQRFATKLSRDQIEALASYLSFVKRIETTNRLHLGHIE